MEKHEKNNELFTYCSLLEDDLFVLNEPKLSVESISGDLAGWIFMTSLRFVMVTGSSFNLMNL